MSWQVYRALTRQPYSASDRMMDESWEAQNLWKQVLVWGDSLSFRVRWLPNKQADRFRTNQTLSNTLKERNLMWAFYLWLRDRYSYNRQMCDLLFQLRQNLEDSNGTHAR